MNRLAHAIAAAPGTAAAGLTLAGTLITAVPPGAAAAATAAVPASAASARLAGAVAPGYAPPERTLTYGMSGSDVMALQQRLAALKYYPGPADGQFGQDTQAAVWAFQEVQGLTVDGVADPATAHALVSPRTYQARYPGGGSLRVEVNLTARVLAVYQGGQVALISHISPGGGYRYCDASGCGYAVTPTGRFLTTAYMPGWITVPLGQMYDPVFFIGTVYAIHGDTYVPVNPVSHGCVRVPVDIAAFFHTLVTTPGTPVYIYR